MALTGLLELGSPVGTNGCAAAERPLPWFWSALAGCDWRSCSSSEAERLRIGESVDDMVEGYL